jgi:hypothetical protein
MEENLIEFARLAYGEHIIHCNEQDPDVIACFLMLDGEEQRARKWLAFAKAKRTGDKQSVRGLLVYLSSNYSGPLDREKRRWLKEKIDHGEITLRNMTFEMLEGTHLEWHYIKKLAGKEVNSTREKRRIKEIYEQMGLTPVEV